jgi:hypothetical protein
MLFKVIVGAASLSVIAIQPINKQVESAWYFGFEKTVSSPSIGIGSLRSPEVTVRLFHYPSGQQIVESVVNTAAEAAGLDVNFRIGQRDEVITAIIHGSINLGIKDVGQISYILATAQHESASFSTLKEIGRGEGCGNGNAYDGWTGIGLVQLTWKGNFEKAKTKLGFSDMSTEQFCRELATRPDVATTILISGMMEGWFTGRSLPQYVAGGKRDYLNARRVVNGTDRASHIAAIARNYEALVEKTLEDYDVK